MRQEPYATSTVAMTIYNLLTVSGRTAEGPLEIADLVRASQHPEATDAMICRAWDGLVERKLLVETPDGWRPVDARRRTVFGRDRSDVAIDKDSGAVTGGWNGWKLKDPVYGAVPVEEVI